MSFDDYVGQINAICLGAFGQSFIFTAQTEGATPTTITGILETGVQPEDLPPADGSTYARLWISADSITPAPVKGDEVESSSTVYKIVRLEEDAGEGLWMLLRADRPVGT